MTKAELVQLIDKVDLDDSEQIVEALINLNIVTVDPEPEPLECYIVKHEGSVYEAFETLEEAEINCNNYRKGKIIHMREVGKDYQKMWEQLKEWNETQNYSTAARQILIPKMESIEKQKKR